MLGTSGVLNGKFWFSKNESIDLGVEFIDHPWTVFYGNYAYNIPEMFGHAGFWGDVQLYFGAGAGAGFWDRTDNCGRWHCKWKETSTGSGNGFFLRASTGLEWFPKRKRYTAFFEAAGSWMWYPTNGSKIDAYLGGRFFF